VSPLRIIILSILIYFLFRLLIGAGRRSDGRPTGPGAGGRGPTPDVLMEDPVCHTLIPAKNAITMKKEGKTLYFCSQNCRDQYTTKQPGEQR
jgi:YHS domain-containing protein